MMDKKEELKKTIKADLVAAFARAPKVDYAAIASLAKEQDGQAQNRKFRQTGKTLSARKTAKQLWFRVLPLSAAAAMVFAGGLPMAPAVSEGPDHRPDQQRLCGGFIL
jgi:hypothetical protein